MISSPRPSDAYRIVRVYLRHPPQAGGMETHIERLSEAQRGLGIGVTNVFNSGACAHEHVRIWPGFDLSRIRPASLRNALFYAGALLAIKRFRSNQTTVLHVHGDWSDFLFSKLLARALEAQVVAATVHSGIRKKVRLAYRFSLSHCDLVLATGRQEQSWLAETLGRETHHMPSAPLDVFFASVAPSTPPIWDVICVAKLRKVKRVDLLLECARLRPHLRFAIIGDGPQLEEIESTMQELELRNVTMLGKLPPADIASHLRRARVFLLPSVEEGTPTAALEAMASGLPVILTPSNDYGWLVEQGVEGVLLQSWEPSEMVSALDEVLSDEARRSSMGARARLRSQRHSWRSNAEQINGLLSSAMGHSGN